MSFELHQWLLAGHIFAFVVWTGTLISAIRILGAHARAGSDPNQAFSALEKTTGIAMDAGATLAILFGILLIVMREAGTRMLIFKGAGFFHTKLLLVMVLLGVHVLIRRKMRQYREGSLQAPDPWMFATTVMSVAGIIILMLVRPF